MRVRQLIEDQGQSHVATLTRLKGIDDIDESLESESSGIATDLAPHISTGFQIGRSTRTPSAGDGGGAKSARRRPPSWKHKAQAGKSSSRNLTPSDLTSPPLESGGKRKTETVNMSPSKKTLTLPSNTVASSYRPLLPQ
ncbi:Uncharacterized protein Rs2_28518 [Raphanus sativus]|nr:Uncharacterized protein Rs2_28518 [Raphanus sativus]